MIANFSFFQNLWLLVLFNQIFIGKPVVIRKPNSFILISFPPQFAPDSNLKMFKKKLNTVQKQITIISEYNKLGN